MTEILRLAKEAAFAHISATPGISAREAVSFLLARLAPGEQDGDPADAEGNSGTAAWVPRVPVDESVAADGSHLVCLADGRKVKMLKRYIRRWGFTPESYRAAFGLPDGYPMTAPGYSARKRQEALAVGLGSDENKAGVNVGRAAEMQAA